MIITHWTLGKLFKMSYTHIQTIFRKGYLGREN